MAVEPFSTVLALFHTRIAAMATEFSTSRSLTVSPYRFALKEEHDQAIDGLYFVEPVRIGGVIGFGSQEAIQDADVAVEVGYFAGGGDLAGGDRFTIAQHAGDDVMWLAHIISNPDKYDGSNSGVRRILWRGSERTVDRPRAQIWTSRFFVEWRSDLNTE